MKIVVDTNIVISALINPSGKESDIFFNPVHNFKFYSCYFLFVEIFKHKDKIIKCSKISEEEILELIYKLSKKIRFINEEQLSDEILTKSVILTKDIDYKDVPFLALSIYLDCYLWTGDKILLEGLNNKGFKNIINTKLLLEQNKDNYY